MDNVYHSACCLKSITDRKIWKATLLVISLLLAIIISILPPSKTINNSIALAALLLSIIFVFRARKNHGDLIASIFLLYFNYSVIVGEYLSDGRFGTPMREVKTVEIYSILIKLMAIFMLVLVMNYKSSDSRKESQYIVERVNSGVAFFFVYLVLLLILVFGIRRGPLLTYEVRITPVYEYASILFILLYRYTARSKTKAKLFALLIVAFALQDLYYGGRVTTLRLITVYALTMYYPKLTKAKIVFFSVLGIAIMTLIGSYRAAYSIAIGDITKAVRMLFETFFVNNTATFAYYASAAIIYTSQMVPLSLRLQSLLEFVFSIFTGSRSFYTVANLSEFSGAYVSHYGGSFVFSYPYFWLGFPGAIAFSLLIVFMMNAFAKYDKILSSYLYIIVISSLPRWYLYGPLVLIRGVFIGSLVLSFALLVESVAGRRGVNKFNMWKKEF